MESLLPSSSYRRGQKMGWKLRHKKTKKKQKKKERGRENTSLKPAVPAVRITPRVITCKRKQNTALTFVYLFE